MITNIFESHAHFDDERYDLDRDELISSLKEKGIAAVVNIGADMKGSRATMEYVDKYDFVYGAVGVHPEYANDVDYTALREFSHHPKIVAIGEIGLDYHYDGYNRDEQITAFKKQLELAKEVDLPVIIHSRDATQDTLDILKEYKPRGVVHCFSGSAEMAKEVVKLGMYIGLGGAVTFKNARKPREVAEIVPEDRLLIETDCPYMTPVPYRGQRCDSSFIPHTAQVIAEVRGVTAEEILDTTRRNANKLFGLEL